MYLKKLVSAVVVALWISLPNPLMARTGHFQGFYDKYESSSNCVSMNLKPRLIRPFLIDDDADLKQMLKDISQVKLLVFDHPVSVKNLMDELKDNYLSNRYDDLLIVKDGTDNVEFKIHKDGNIIDELIMLVSDTQSMVVLYIQGNIDLIKVKELSKTISAKGINHLDQLP